MGCHRHEFAGSRKIVAQLADGAVDPLPFVTESEFEFLSRRALEEARLAQHAPNAAAANAHRYLAAAYSDQLARHIATHSELEELLEAVP